MVTILELAREIRHHIVNHSTGRLDLAYDDRHVFVDFSDGTVITSREVFLPCLRENPIGFEFYTREIPVPEDHESGASYLIEAMESLSPEILGAVWAPYVEWTIDLPQDPEIHRSLVGDHQAEGPGRLRRMMRLAVAGVLKLEPPALKSVEEEIVSIRQGTGRGDYWQVLGIGRTATAADVKHAYRKLVRKYHPDRWHSNENSELGERAAEAFLDVRYCYERALAAVPTPLPAPASPRTEPVEATRPAAAPMPPQEQAQPREQPPLTQTAPGKSAQPKAQDAAAMAGRYSASHDKQLSNQNSLFRRIFEKVFKAA